MKLQQLKYLIAIRDHNLNVSVASDALFTSQPGVSKQIGLLESELGVRIFERRGKHLHRITPVGEEIIKCAEAMLNIESKIKAISREYLDPTVGTLNIHTTHTIARYLLPKSVTYFTKKYPKISFHLHPVMSASKEQISKGYSDFSIVAHEIGFDKELIALPAYLWTLSLVVPQDHPLAKVKKPTLEQLCHYPILSYEWRHWPSGAGRGVSGGGADPELLHDGNGCRSDQTLRGAGLWHRHHLLAGGQRHRQPRAGLHQSGAPVQALPGADLFQQEHLAAELHV